MEQLHQRKIKDNERHKRRPHMRMEGILQPSEVVEGEGRMTVCVRAGSIPIAVIGRQGHLVKITDASWQLLHPPFCGIRTSERSGTNLISVIALTCSIIKC